MEFNVEKYVLKLYETVFYFACLFLQARILPELQPQAEMHHNINEHMWENVYKIPFMVRFSNNIRELQFKLIHGILSVNKLLYKMHISNNCKCEFCYFYDQTIEHIYYDCFVIKNFWFQVNTLLKTQNLLTNDLTKRDILLGFELNENEPDLLINQIVLFGKRFIFSCKQNVSRLNLNNFKVYIAYHLSPVISHRTTSTVMEHENALFFFVV